MGQPNSPDNSAAASRVLKRLWAVRPVDQPHAGGAGEMSFFGSTPRFLNSGLFTLLRQKAPWDAPRLAAGRLHFVVYKKSYFVYWGTVPQFAPNLLPALM